MRFNYEYRSSDNVLHSDVIEASTKEQAFTLLKGRGIKPCRVYDAPGFFNRLFGKGKRWIAICILAVVALLFCVLFYRLQSDSTRQTAVNLIESPLRRQIVGDMAVIEKGIRTGWSDTFEFEGERFLAGFAVPGVPVSVRNTTEDEIKAALGRDIAPAPDDSIESRQIKAVVAGMKNELRRFLDRKGTIQEYGLRLVRRQEEEIGYYNRIKVELEELAKQNLPDAALIETWENRNAKLRAMGIRPVPFPE